MDSADSKGGVEGLGLVLLVMLATLVSPLLKQGDQDDDVWRKWRLSWTVEL